MVSYSKQTTEAVKLRNPIEDVVRERVPDLRRAGALWQACCPFHEERTPSFKVDPRKGTWRCYGACQDGGDQIKFVQRAYNVDFVEALQMLAARVGMALPEDEVRTPAADTDPLYEILRRAESFYRGQLRRPDGAVALDYLRGRGLTDTTLDAFGIGFAPAAGRVLFDAARAVGVEPNRLVELGLARVDESSGRARDFFRGRVMFPVRDIKGRTVGFGARRLSDDDAHGPKYVNTPQSPLFHKGRLIYGLDLALDHVRRAGHLILVEGYTDVMAAHQVGLRTVVAVLGTATTEEHAALVRRSGARRVSLVFDGDDAGRKATLRALEGLLPLDVSIDVVRLSGVKDPCDLLIANGRGPLDEELARAVDWFAHLVEWVATLQGDARWKAIDQVLGLLWRLPRAIVRDERCAELARALDVPVEGVREQMASLPERRRALARAAAAEQSRLAERSDISGARAGLDGAAAPRMARLVEAAWRGIVGVLLHAPALASHARDWAPSCPPGPLRRLLEAILELDARHAGGFTLEQVFAALGDDPARDLAAELAHAAATTDDPQSELSEHWEALERWELDQRLFEARFDPHQGPAPLAPQDDASVDGEPVENGAARDDERELRLLAELNAQAGLIKNQRRFAPASRTRAESRGAQQGA